MRNYEIRDDFDVFAIEDETRSRVTATRRKNTRRKMINKICNYLP